MILSHCTHDTVLHVTMNLRASDREEIYALRAEENPFLLMNEVMAQSRFAWVAWHDGHPCAIFGGTPVHPGVWQMFAFGTDAFPRIARPLTRFARERCIPTLFGELGAHRLHADSHEKHVEAHRWLERLGAVCEGVKRGLGKDGSNYLAFALTRPVE